MDTRSSENNTEYRAELDKARKDIQAAVYAGLFSGGITFIVFLAVTSNPTIAQKTGLDGWLFIDVALIFGLTYGTYRNNPICAKVMLGYFVVSKLIQIGSGHFAPGSIPLSGYLMYCFYRGVIGTSAYQRLQADGDRDLPIPGDISNTDNSQNMSDNRAAVEKFWVADRLVELCNGDRSQAEWLLHQLRRKHPGKDMDWYNDRAIAAQTESCASKYRSDPNTGELAG